MSDYQIDEQNSIFFTHHPPVLPEDTTVMFLNALTGDTTMWENTIAPALRSEGYGTISFNYRGQTNSPFSTDINLDANLIVEDTLRLLQFIQPQKVIFCGLSIGGLYAIQAYLSGRSDSEVNGLVLINTLRRQSVRLDWINDALVRCAEVGGLQLFRDLFVPLLFNEDWQANNRDGFLTTVPYTPLERTEGHYNLLKNAGSTNWNQPYEELNLPVLAITGLQDRVFLDLANVEELIRRMPQCSHKTMPNCGHMIPAEQPLQLTEQLLQFTSEVGS